MSDAAQSSFVASAPTSPKKTKTEAAQKPKATTATAKATTKSVKAKVPPNPHSPLFEMAVEAIRALEEDNGSSRSSIYKYIVDHCNQRSSNNLTKHLKKALYRGVAEGYFKADGAGKEERFRLGDKKPTVAKKRNAPAEAAGSSKPETETGAPVVKTEISSEETSELEEEQGRQAETIRIKQECQESEEAEGSR